MCYHCYFEIFFSYHIGTNSIPVSVKEKNNHTYSSDDTYQQLHEIQSNQIESQTRRPEAQGQAQNQAHSNHQHSQSNLRGFNIAAAAFLHHHAAAASVAAAAAVAANKSPVDLAPRTAPNGLYWPGFQGLVSNPLVWRNRLTRKL